jgi:hypothetical protein
MTAGALGRAEEPEVTVLQAVPVNTITAASAAAPACSAGLHRKGAAGVFEMWRPAIAYWRERALKAALRAALATFLSG